MLYLAKLPFIFYFRDIFHGYRNTVSILVYGRKSNLFFIADTNFLLYACDGDKELLKTSQSYVPLKFLLTYCKSRCSDESVKQYERQIYERIIKVS